MNQNDLALRSQQAVLSGCFGLHPLQGMIGQQAAQQYRFASSRDECEVYALSRDFGLYIKQAEDAMKEDA